MAAVRLWTRHRSWQACIAHTLWVA